MRQILVAIVFSLLLYSCSKTKNNNSLGTIKPNEVLNENNSSSSPNLATSWASWIGEDTIGTPYIANFSPSVQYDKHNYAIVQDINGIMLIANRKGLLVYDGKEWNMVKTRHFTFTLKQDPYSGHVLAGCHGGFGLITTDSHGLYQYVSMSPDNVRDNFTDIAIFSKNIYFYSSTAIYIYSRADTSAKYVFEPTIASKFNGFVSVGEHFFVNLSDRGLVELTPNVARSLDKPNSKQSEKSPKTISLAEDCDLENENILFSIPFSKTQTLFGATNNRLYLFDGEKISPYNCDASGMLKSSSLQGAINLSDQEFAVSTVNGGCLVINKNTKKTVVNLNYQAGLSDDEIQAIGIDASKGLWLSMPSGISRVNFGLHVKNYGSLPGLEGKLLSVSETGNSIYAGTTSGVFMLYQVKDVKEVTKLMKCKTDDDNANIVSLEPKVEDVFKTNTNNTNNSDKKTNLFSRVIKSVSDKVTGNKTNKEEPKKDEALKDESKKEELSKTQKTSWFSRILGRDKKTKDKQEPIDNKPHTIKDDLTNLENQKQAINETPVTNELVKPKKTSMSSVPQKFYTLQSIKYAYKKVTGINDRCKSFYSTGDKLLVAGNTGAYEIIGDKSIPIIKDRYVNSIYLSEYVQDRYYFCCNNGVVEMTYNNGKWIETENLKEFQRPIYSVVEENESTLWLGSENMAYKAKIDPSGAAVSIDQFTVGNRFFDPVFAKKEGNSLIFYTEGGMFRLNKKNQNIETVRLNFKIPEQGLKYLFGKNSSWVYNGNDWLIPYQTLSRDTLLGKYFNAFDQVVDIFVPGKAHFWLVDKSKSLYKIKIENGNTDDKSKFDIFLKTISYNNGKYVDLSELSVDFDNSLLKFNILAPYYLKDNSVKYQYQIEGKGYTGQWTGWQDETNIKFPYLPSGNFKLVIKAKNLLGSVSPEKTFYFYVRPPFWQTWWFYSFIVMVLAYSVYAVIKWRTAALEKDKRILEEKVLERTAEIEKQKQKIEHQNNEIKGSIEYASRIQKAALPNKEVLEGLPLNYFIYFKPKDIVSGDYYWFSKLGNKLIITAADCTGHGVPGGFLSMLGMAFLNDIVVNNNVSSPGTILDQLREKIINQLNHAEIAIKDGMDISLCMIDFDTRKLWFAGAYNPLILVRNGELSELKADRMPIGLWHKNLMQNFNTQCIDLQSKDCIYLSSDGYCDQFGGSKGRKFLPKNYREMLLSMAKMNMYEQNAHLTKTMQFWMQAYEQVDDMLVIGLQIK